MITIVDFLQKVDQYILNPILELLFAVAFVYFIWSVIKLINADGSDKAEARTAVMWSVVGMFIMISVYGVINLVLSTFQIDKSSTSYIQSNLKGQ
jgi:TRAP-type C4-dicarboxylate transport system permease small subunit